MQNLMDTRPENYIPHRGAMCLLSRVLEANEQRAVAEVDVPIDGLFARDGGVPAWIGIEYMAQTISAWSGGRARREGGAPRIGMLLGSRHYQMHRAAFPAGSCLRVEAQCDFMAANGMGIFECRIELDGMPVAQGRLSVYEPPTEQTPPLASSAPALQTVHVTSSS